MASIAGLAALVLAGSAAALLSPAQTVTNAAPVTALSVTGQSVVFAVGRTRANCGSVRLWVPPSRALWTFGTRTILACEENPSGGYGIPSVAVTGRRVLWLTRIGGNITDWQLWTATPTRRTARRLAFASSETDGPAAIVLGGGTADGVPYAVGHTLTLVEPSGRRGFRTTVDSPVRLLASGTGPGGARVVAALADGSVLAFSGTGVLLQSDDYAPNEVRAIALGAVGPLVQVGSTVDIGPVGGGSQVTLPPGALMLDYEQGRIVYRKGIQARSRQISTGADTLLRVIPIRKWQPMLFTTDAWGSAWATDRRVSWRPGPIG